MQLFYAFAKPALPQNFQYLLAQLALLVLVQFAEQVHFQEQTILQARLQQQVYERFGIDPAGIQLIEAHGTGTVLGDPIEVEGLKRSFAAHDRSGCSRRIGASCLVNGPSCQVKA